MPDTSWLASTRWMPCERPRRARSSSSVTASRVTASRSPNSNWNSSITATIRGQRPSGSVARSSSSFVTSCALAACGAAAHLVGEVLQQREPELAVVVDVDADQPRVRQPASGPPAGRELGERHALLEVEQVERQLVAAE